MILTTHSPYLIDYTTLSVKAASITPKTEDAQKRLDKIVPPNSRVTGSDVCIYQIDGGRISEVEKYDDMPSDDNMLNRELNDTNELFAQLLELEDE